MAGRPRKPVDSPEQEALRAYWREKAREKYYRRKKGFIVPEPLARLDKEEKKE